MVDRKSARAFSNATSRVVLQGLDASSRLTSTSAPSGGRSTGSAGSIRPSWIRALIWDMKSKGEFVHADTKRRHKIFAEEFSGMNRRQSSGPDHLSSSSESAISTSEASPSRHTKQRRH